jgi:hypothetical protein
MFIFMPFLELSLSTLSTILCSLHLFLQLWQYRLRTSGYSSVVYEVWLKRLHLTMPSP